MKRNGFMVYEYELIENGVKRVIEVTYRIDYKKIYAKKREEGDTTFRIKLLSSFYWS